MRPGSASWNFDDMDNAWARARGAVAAWLLAGSAVSTAVVLSAHLAPASPLGAPGWWSWLLTGTQVVALWAAGTSRGWGWILGAGVQLPWIAYAVLTGQFGFIPGCVVSAAVQTASFVRHRAHLPVASSGRSASRAYERPSRVVETFRRRKHGHGPVVLPMPLPDPTPIITYQRDTRRAT